MSSVAVRLPRSLVAVTALVLPVALTAPAPAASAEAADPLLVAVGEATYLVPPDGSLTSRTGTALDHVTRAPDGTVYASNTFAGESTAAGIYRIEEDGQATQLTGDRWVTGMATDDGGLVYAKNRCLGGSDVGKKVARIIRRDLATQETAVVADRLPALSGIDVEADGDIVAVEDPNQFCGTRSPGTDALLRISATDGGVTPLARFLPFPTDVAVDTDGSLLVTASGYSDPENDTEDMDGGAVLRVPAAGGDPVVAARVSFPGGIDVASDGTVYTAGLTYNGDHESAPTGTIQRVTDGGAVSEVLDVDPLLRDVAVEGGIVPPTIEALLVSGGRPNQAGWYRSEVTVEFTCDEGSAPLADGCPLAIDLADADRTVRRTVTATDGGSGSVSVRVRVDTTAPSLATRRTGQAPYAPSARPVRCGISDELSGPAGDCVVSYGPVRTRDGGSRYRTWSAEGRDVAGNPGVARGRFAVRR